MRVLSRIGITMGDPAGIGPEVICKALAAMPDDFFAEGRVDSPPQEREEL